MARLPPHRLSVVYSYMRFFNHPTTSKHLNDATLSPQEGAHDASMADVTNVLGFSPFIMNNNLKLCRQIARWRVASHTVGSHATP